MIFLFLFVGAVVGAATLDSGAGAIAGLLLGGLLGVLFGRTARLEAQQKTLQKELSAALARLRAAERLAAQANAPGPRAAGETVAAHAAEMRPPVRPAAEAQTANEPHPTGKPPLSHQAMADDDTIPDWQMPELPPLPPLSPRSPLPPPLPAACGLASPVALKTLPAGELLPPAAVVTAMPPVWADVPPPQPASWGGVPPPPPASGAQPPLHPQAVAASGPQKEAAALPQGDAPQRGMPHQPREPRQPGLRDQIWQLLFGGNMLLKAGGLILFLGLAFLLRYTAAYIPIEARYAGVAATALALLVIGWRLRQKRPAYGLALQGLAVGILYLTIFAAMKLHPLVPPPLGFGLMVAVCAGAAVLAVRQDALSLALAGSLGGFAAPVLASTGSGNYVALFSYLLLLDLGIAAAAAFRAWRLLNLVGFFGTFGLFSVWQQRAYQVGDWAAAEAFLAAFGVLFVAILIAFARHLRLGREEDEPPGGDPLLRALDGRADMVDGALAFGVPLAVFTLHVLMSRHLEFGAAFGALALGGFYLTLAWVLLWRGQGRYRLLVEVFIALGVVFASLAIPLALDTRWTAASWALEAAGIYWIGVRQGRSLSRAFAGLLVCGALASFMLSLGPVMPEGAPCLGGSWLAALILGLALLFIHRQMILAPAQAVSKSERELASPLALAGVLCLYLLPPLLLSWDDSLPVWAVLGLATIYLALRYNVVFCLLAGFALQLFAGAGFAFSQHGAGAAGMAVLGRGGEGFFMALVIGAAMLGSVFLASGRRDRAADSLRPLLGLMVLAALAVLNLALLFVLPWADLWPAWALTATLILALALRLGNRAALAFALGLEIFAGLGLLQHLGGQPDDGALPAFAHQGWWSALLFALAGHGAAWLLHRHRQREGEAAIATRLPDFLPLLWGGLWWFYAWGNELHRAIPVAGEMLAATVLLLCVTQLLWHGLARWQNWPTPAYFTLSHLPLAAALLLAAISAQGHPLPHYGGLAWPLAAAVHFFLLRRLEDRQNDIPLALWHGLGVWWLLLLGGSELRWQFAQLGGPGSAWPLLGWAILPLAYLALATRWINRGADGRGWPLGLYGEMYSRLAAWPVALYMAGWVALGNFSSTGQAAPLPYLPLMNPLELAQMAALLILLAWLRSQQTVFSSAFVRHGLGGALAFLCLTAGVFRAVHHLHGVPWHLPTLMASLVLQAALSIVWSLVAGGLMVLASRRGWRGLWLAGAGLMALVVVKLFLVELSQSGAIERIISFIVVGVLLLALGYFVPVPPKRKEDAAP